MVSRMLSCSHVPWTMSFAFVPPSETPCSRDLQITQKNACTPEKQADLKHCRPCYSILMGDSSSKFEHLATCICYQATFCSIIQMHLACTSACIQAYHIPLLPVWLVLHSSLVQMHHLLKELQMYTSNLFSAQPLPKQRLFNSVQKSSKHTGWHESLTLCRSMFVYAIDQIAPCYRAPEFHPGMTTTKLRPVWLP